MPTYRAAGTSKPRSANRREATRQRLIDAARRLLSEQGYEHTSVTQIAEEAGVTHSLINAYFGGKAGLLHAVRMAQNKDQLSVMHEMRPLNGTLRERLSTAVGHWTEHALQDRELLAVLQAYSWQWPQETEDMEQAQRREMLKPLAAALQVGVDAGQLRSDLDIPSALEVLRSIFNQALRQALFENLTPEECQQIIVKRFDIVWDGILEHREDAVGDQHTPASNFS
ncbi:MAG: helix-turn-helix domain-containing protein [Pseudomonadota bacterium]